MNAAEERDIKHMGPNTALYELLRALDTADDERTAALAARLPQAVCDYGFYPSVFPTVAEYVTENGRWA